ncbi:uncharacterized protein PG986_005090 [Apiospora aurea]|uniref:Heterokaryon incompatibility domain-containing protein n=1 Tax=Apiospora aurea TaxID=335848 RepID=A0ABR1QGK2_9PEZI
MYLINIDTLKLERFDVNAPPYAILSHRWRDGEVSFGEFADPAKRQGKAGFAKILNTCGQARRDRLAYVWVDTCCIDKSSSAELSEVINSMFAWYQGAKVCYAFLDDVVTGAQNTESPGSSRPSFDYMAQSVWFERGWTLQELIAPKGVVFFCKEEGSQETKWSHLGSRESLAEIIAKITEIPEEILYGRKRVFAYSVSMRMSWAAKRQTTRPEDIAYCLMGLFGVNMPLLYGEGSKAFLRLQEEIMRTIDDDTLFVWKEPPSSVFTGFRGIFAPLPNFFQGTGHFVPIPSMEPDGLFVNTAKGLRTNATVCPTRKDLERMGVRELDQSYLLLPLNCAQSSHENGMHAAIVLQWKHNRTYLRLPSRNLFEVKDMYVSRDSTVFVAKLDTLYRHMTFDSLDFDRLNFVFQLPDKGVTFLEKISPLEGRYIPARSTFLMDCLVKNSGNIGFAFHLEEARQLLLVAIEFSEARETGGGEQKASYRIVPDVLPIGPKKEDYESRLAKARDKLLSRGRDKRMSFRGSNAAMSAYDPRPVGELVTQDVRFGSADGFSSAQLRVSMVREEGSFNAHLYILRISFLGLKIPYSEPL